MCVSTTAAWARHRRDQGAQPGVQDHSLGQSWRQAAAHPGSRVHGPCSRVTPGTRTGAHEHAVHTLLHAACRTCRAGHGHSEDGKPGEEGQHPMGGAEGTRHGGGSAEGPRTFVRPGSLSLRASTAPLASVAHLLLPVQRGQRFCLRRLLCTTATWICVHGRVAVHVPVSTNRRPHRRNCRRSPVCDLHAPPRPSPHSPQTLPVFKRENSRDLAFLSAAIEERALGKRWRPSGPSSSSSARRSPRTCWPVALWWRCVFSGVWARWLAFSVRTRVSSDGRKWT